MKERCRQSTSWGSVQYQIVLSTYIAWFFIGKRKKKKVGKRIILSVHEQNSSSERGYKRAYLGEDAMQSFNIWFPASSFILFGAFLHADAKNCN